MIEITRHEKDNELHGFTFYAQNEIILLVYDSAVWYSKTRYRGHCSVGAPSINAQATAFQSFADLEQFIKSNDLTEYNHPADKWHEENKTFRIFMTKENSIQISEDYPEMALYRKENNIELYKEHEGVYFYTNYFETGHRELLENYATITETKS